MASRSLTEVFILMRNNAMQSRHIYSEQGINDRVALVDHTEEDVEFGRVPPSWTSAVEETQFTAVKLKRQLLLLSELQSKVISRPRLDDGGEEETQIDALTHEISRMFNSAHRLVSQIRSEASHAGSVKERRLGQSVVSALISALQNLSQEFRALQSSYLNKVNSREERSKAYFEVDLTSGVCYDDHSTLVEDLDWLGGVAGDPRSERLQAVVGVETQAVVLATREKEVQAIVRSIVDLNDLFKDLGRAVVDQGTILDRIDYNIESTQVEVFEGARELQKASQHQRASSKMMCIIVLASVTTALTALLVIVKT